MRLTTVDIACASILLVGIVFLSYEWDQMRLREVEEAHEEGRREGLHDAWMACPYMQTSCDNSECEWQQKDNAVGVCMLVDWHLERRMLDLRECIHLGGCTETVWGDDLDPWQSAYVQQRQMHRPRWERDEPGHWDHPGRGEIRHDPADFDGSRLP